MQAYLVRKDFVGALTQQLFLPRIIISPEGTIGVPCICLANLRSSGYHNVYPQLTQVRQFQIIHPILVSLALLIAAHLKYSLWCMIETKKLSFLPTSLLFNLGARCDELSRRCRRTAVQPGRDMEGKEELLWLTDQVIYGERV